MKTLDQSAPFRMSFGDDDRLFAAAELRMGGEHQQTVRISRTDGRAR